MSQNASAYGQPATDTSFRNKYSSSTYTPSSTTRTPAEREEAKLRYESKLAGHKHYLKPLDGTETTTSARAATLDLSSHIGRVQLVPAGSTVGKRGRGAGFYCESCDLTFKDNKQWVEHVNSLQHLRAIGETGEVVAASAADVRRRVDEVWERMAARVREKVVTLSERLEVRREEEDKEREEKRRKRKEAVEKKRVAREEEARVKMEYGDDVRNLAEHDEDDMLAAMGIKSFGTSKK